MISHILHSFFPDGRELISEAISDCRLAYFDSKCWGQIFPSQNSKNINIPVSIPAIMIQLVLLQPERLHSPFLRHQSNAVIEMRSKDHVWVIVISAFD